MMHRIWARGVRRLRRVRDDAGAILIIALLITTMIAVVVGALLTRGDGSLRASVQLRQVAGDTYAADGAAQVAINALRTGYHPAGSSEPADWVYTNGRIDGDALRAILDGCEIDLSGEAAARASAERLAAAGFVVARKRGNCLDQSGFPRAVQAEDTDFRPIKETEVNVFQNWCIGVLVGLGDTGHGENDFFIVAH